MEGIGLYNNALIADDEQDTCDSLRKILERRGYRVMITLDGFEAKEILKRNEFNLIFLDCILPGMSGFDLIKFSREKNPEATIVVFTGHPEVDGRIAGDLGANTFLQKPLSVEMIENILEGMK